MSARLITVNDLYSFDSSGYVELEEFTDVVGMHRIFKRPFLWPELYRSPGTVVNSVSA